MSTHDYFDRVRGAVHNFSLLQARRVVIVGVGMTGSQMAEWLANCGVGHLRFIDHDILKRENLSRHVLDEDYLGQNKAVGMAAYLAKVPGLETQGVPYKIDRSVSDDFLDQLLDADLIIAATDQQDVQRRVGRSALRLGIESIFPALYTQGGGEIVVQFDAQLPCFSCWDEFRPPDRPLRGPALLPHTALPVIYTALRLSLGLLDLRSEDRDMFTTSWGEPPYQMFALNRFGALESAQLERDRSCPACGGRRVLGREIRPASQPLFPFVTTARPETIARPITPRPFVPMSRHESVRPTEGVRWWLIATMLTAIIIVLIMALNSSNSSQLEYPPPEPAPSQTATQKAPSEATPADSSSEEGGESESGEETKAE